jgi:putative transposase
MKRKDDPRMIERLKEIAMQRRRFGYRRLTLMLRRDDFIVSHKRVHRIYRAHGLQIRARRKRGVRHIRGNVVPAVHRPNELAGRSISFMTRRAVDGSFGRLPSSMITVGNA